ncbi:MAG TPA: HAD-IA family hydrolase [Solirubrobacteraceae bacterium]
MDEPAFSGTSWVSASTSTRCTTALRWAATKSDPAFYSRVERRTGLAPGAHCLIDDRIENVEAARDAGWQAFLWTASSRLRDVLRSIQR